MRVWITCFIVLFGGVELLQWFQQFSLPLPVFIVGGAFLAIASNYEKLSPLPFRLGNEESKLPTDESPTMTAVQPAVQMPTVKRSDRAISFEIRKPFRPGD